MNEEFEFEQVDKKTYERPDPMRPNNHGSVRVFPDGIRFITLCVANITVNDLENFLEMAKNCS